MNVGGSKMTTTMKVNGFSPRKTQFRADALQALAVFLAVPGRKVETLQENNVCTVRLTTLDKKCWEGNGFTISTAIAEALRLLPRELRTSNARILAMPFSGAQLDKLASVIVNNVLDTEPGAWDSVEQAVRMHEDDVHEIAAERFGRRMTPREWRSVTEIATPLVAALNSRAIRSETK